jgi:hypothetical protein
MEKLNDLELGQVTGGHWGTTAVVGSIGGTAVVGMP